MAKLKITNLMPESVRLSEFHDYDFTLGRHSKTSAVFNAEGEFPDGHDFRIVFQGKNLAYKDGELSKGTVTKITYEDLDGNDLAVVSGLKLNAKFLPDLTGQEFYSKLFEGKDTIGGSDAGDLIDAGPGKNRLTGGLGEDVFYIQVGSSTTITDFRALPDAEGQDYLAFWERDLMEWGRVTQDGDDVVFDLSDGTFVRLLNVQLFDINSEDIALLG